MAGAGWFVAGALAAAVVTAWASRRRNRAAVARAAAAVARVADVAAEESPDAWPRGWDEVAAAARRTRRTILDREEATESRLRDLQAILYSTTSGFIAMDPLHRVLDLNPAAARWLQADPATARGRLVQEVARHPELNRFLDDAFDATAPIERVLRVAAAPLGDAGPLSLRAASEPLRDATGRAVGLLVSLQDVTRVERLESLRSEFVANVSHELRTPITSIKGYVETLLQIGVEEPERVRRFLEIVKRNADRLSSLVEDLLALASLEQAETEERPELAIGPVGGEAIVRTVVDLLGPTADARRIRIDERIDPAVSVLANATLAEQALSNLLSNAIRYSPEGSRVTLSVRGREGMGELAVADEGPGIAPRHLDRIFERFYRVDKARSSSMGGTGLGLALVKHIAQALGGRVEVESVLGAGSRFAILLPLTPPSNASPSNRSPSNTSPSNTPLTGS